MIKAVFFDIDGTLLDPKTKEMPQSTLQALHELHENGIKVFVATGRSPITLDVVKNYFDFDGYLTCNGQYCFNSQEVIYEKYIDENDIKTILPYVNQENIPVLFAELTCCYSNIHNYLLDESADYLNEPRYPVRKPDEIIGQKIVQMMAYMDEKEDEDFLKRASHCKSARWTDRFADIIPIDGGKNVGIERMIEYYQIDISEVMAFGDGKNDLDMLRYANIGVAMGNALDIVKEASDFVTKSVDDNGIVYALKELKVI
ncbi:Cof-type HAD-IIB family hydrolase [uncultured Thomasclavelia sp.]|uniref:Cof-type HAD-IIB family hydrolase n=1 Tax=uncultured Thomasclavelia sp. TaxID=3025759 RepID=UPI0025CBB69E|nr:Cof-type HAD-IIB family hydrolase [uncultured Thomasclavelia sp.]